MERLASTAELMDGPLDDDVALATNLRDLRRVNRLLGGTDLSRRALAALVDGGPAPLTLLDVGTGAADIPAALLADARRTGTSVRITAIDSRHEMLAAAVATDPSLANLPGLHLRVGDGLALTDADGSFDVVHASMVLHHLEPPEAVVLLREMARVARTGIVVNDLVRSRLAWVGAWLMSHLLTRSRFTRRDAPLSVRRAYTGPELQALLTEAGLRPIAAFHGGVRPSARDRGGRRRVAMTAPESHEIVVVGGGLAGSAVALILARAGRAVTLIERAPAYRWHAGGVFTSPAAVVALRRLGLSEAVLGDAVRPTPGDARRDARRRPVPVDLWRRRQPRPVGGRSRPGRPRSGPPRRRGRCRRRGPAWNQRDRDRAADAAQRPDPGRDPGRERGRRRRADEPRCPGRRGRRRHPVDRGAVARSDPIGAVRRPGRV